MLSNKEQVAPVQVGEKGSVTLNGMRDFSSTIQRNFDILFEAGHIHTTRTTAPGAKEGMIGDIVLVELGTSAYIYIKFPTLGWKRILAS